MVRAILEKKIKALKKPVSIQLLTGCFLYVQRHRGLELAMLVLSFGWFLVKM